jgi:hypothetical protein
VNDQAALAAKILLAAAAGGIGASVSTMETTHKAGRGSARPGFRRCARSAGIKCYVQNVAQSKNYYRLSIA